MGKGSARRPQKIGAEEMEERWKTVFAKPKCPVCGSKDSELKSGHSATGELVYFRECEKCGHEYDHG